MEIKKIVDYVNRGYVASEYLRAPEIYYYMDAVIDDINDRLQAKFPTISDWEDFVDHWNEFVTKGRPLPDTDERAYPVFRGPDNQALFLRDKTKYDAFPDRYIRSVLALGVAVKFYTRDEEGEQIALDYQNRYEMALFKMTRDYHNQVPWYFQNNEGGFIDFTYVHELGPHDLHPRGVVLRGKNTKIL